ncbi:MAG: succinate dehydrogenase/fumarate reductase cytochrome b subunit [Prevotellaceae bacterium]|nr:succinate dehydrogenase/fumarate reductase cytochrome b subunit [Prevotellaceae bacterium]
MWLCNSSIGRKVVMSVTGIALILFLTFHGCMNVVALISGEAYNMICEFLGANWYAVVATAGLAALTVIHILYAFWLTLQNRKARGNNRYAVTSKPEKVEWASQNMLVLGIIVVLGMLLHLFNFWYNMMLPELLYGKFDAMMAAQANGVPAPGDGYAWIRFTFSCPVYVVLYIVWLAALWFHLTHGFWSAIQTIGWSGHIWFNRWKTIGNIYVTILVLMFLAVVLGFAFCGSCGSACC